MNALIDTCDFLWFVTDDPKLSLRYRHAIMDPENAVFFERRFDFRNLNQVRTQKISLAGTAGTLHP